MYYREDINRKKNVFFWELPGTLIPPLTPIRATWSFFSDVKIQDLKVTWGRVDHNDGQFFRAMEWLMFFFRPPLPSMVFQWF